MAEFTVKNAKITGVSLVLGEIERQIDTEPEYYNHDQQLLARLKKRIGFGTRYTADPATTTSDLCVRASHDLLRLLHLEPADINAIISVTQTPDYRMPGNAHVLHRSLGLQKNAPALDVGMGCSGYVYGLWLAAMTAASGGYRVLLVAGDTLSKAVNAADRALAPLCGDAGSATIIEFSQSAGEMRFILRTDGNGLEKMHIPAGGFRAPSTAETREAVTYGDGGMRSRDDVHMDGFGIFDFTMTEQPALLADILAFAGKRVEDIDYFVLHQANRYIVETIAKAAKIPAGKIPSDLFTRFGNQNSASIPGVLCGALGEKLAGKKVQAVMQGFGVGLSWGACQLELDTILCAAPVRHQAGTRTLDDEGIPAWSGFEK